MIPSKKGEWQKARAKFNKNCDVCPDNIILLVAMSTATSSRMKARRPKRAADVRGRRGLTKAYEGDVRSYLPEGNEDHQQPEFIRQLIQENKSSSNGATVPRLRIKHQKIAKLAHHGSADRARSRRPIKQYLARDAKNGDGDGPIAVVGEKATGSVRADETTGYNPARKEVHSIYTARCATTFSFKRYQTHMYDLIVFFGVRARSCRDDRGITTAVITTAVSRWFVMFLL